MNKTITRIKSNPVPTLLAALYVTIAIATFRHSALGFATLEGGNWALGSLSACAIDAGMMLSASALRKRRDGWLVAGLVLSAMVSTYTQLLHSVGTAGVVEIAPGAMWLGGFAVGVANIRVILLPAALPLLSIIFAFAAKGAGEVESEKSVDLGKLAQNIKGKHNQAVVYITKGATREQVIEYTGCGPRTYEAALASVRNGGSQ